MQNRASFCYSLQCSDIVGLGNRNVIYPVKSWVLVCWWWRFDWRFVRLKTPVVTTTYFRHP